MKQKHNISILAGNFRVCRNATGEITVDSQMNAFEAALHLARKCCDDSKIMPRISVAFDHHGIFRLQFLAENLSNTQKRRPRLSHLHPSIQEIFLPLSKKYKIDLSEIWAIHEDSARQHLVHTISTADIPEILLRRMQTTVKREPTQDTNNFESSQKLTCAAITKEYFERAIGEFNSSENILEVFFEDHLWSRSLAYVRGLQLSHLLGVSSTIRLNMVNNEGKVIQGEKISASKAMGELNEYSC